jgi:exodeoxyribonuclease VII small subunit
MSPSKKAKKSGFEQSLADLEELVQSLESGDIGLEESLEKFEKGIKLYKQCKKDLGAVEKKIKVLTDSLKEENLD